MAIIVNRSMLESGRVYLYVGNLTWNWLETQYYNLFFGLLSGIHVLPNYNMLVILKARSTDPGASWREKW